MSDTLLTPTPEIRQPDRTSESLTRPSRLTWARHYVAQSSLFILIALFLVVFSLAKPQEFANWNNISTILYSNAVTGVVALAALIPLLSGEVDISIGGVMGVSGVFVAWAFGQGWPMVPAIAGALACGVIVGVANALLVVRIGLNSFISTLAMTTILAGVATLITGGGSLYSGIPTSFTSLVADHLLGVPLAVVYTVLITAVIAYGTSRTAFGRRLRATGSGRDAARLIGVRTTRYVAVAFVLSGLVAALAGVLETAELASASPTTGNSFTLSAIAAVFLGAIVSRRSRLNAWGTITAVVMLGIGLTGLTMIGAPAWVPDVFNGVALIVALAISKGAGAASPVAAIGRIGS
jgi:ribose transport system permease protein